MCLLTPNSPPSSPPPRAPPSRTTPSSAFSPPRAGPKKKSTRPSPPSIGPKPASRSPAPPAAGTSAKDAFFYLILFTTLATWTIALANLAFSLIDRWLGDPLFAAESASSYDLTFSLAAIIVAFPLFLLISRAILAESAAHPEKLQSPIRKWLTYLALVAAVCVFMGDLITALAFLLRGEITSRFLLKAVVVLLLSGGVFSYYFISLRKPAFDQRLDRLMAGLATAAVLLTIALGFLNLGSPHVQRAYRADTQLTQRLSGLDFAVRNFYLTHDKQLPTTLDLLPANLTSDPQSHVPYEYRPLQGNRFELCATFARPSQEVPNRTPWTHPAGHHCFQLDATQSSPYPIGPTY